MKVLVVDDDAVTRLTVSRLVTRLGHDCVPAENGRLAWEALQAAADIDVVITDRMMPDVDGLELCRRIRAGAAGRAYTYVVLMSAMGSDEHARDGMVAGADDYLAKPLRLVQLELKLIAAARLAALHRNLDRLADEMRELARRDPLTRLNNRLQLTEDIDGLTARVERYDYRYSLALFDIDHFKRYNDCYGHQRGDAALQAVAGVLRTRGRRGDVAYRYGGEEFLVIFPAQSGAGALTAARRVLADVRKLAIPHAGGLNGLLTMSAGVCELTTAMPDVERVLRRADAALYQAKEYGRDQAVLSEPTPPTQLDAVVAASTVAPLH